MDTFHEAFFSIFMILWGFLMLFNIASILNKTAVRFSRLRLFSPLWLYGPLVVLNPWWRLGYLDRGRQFLGIWLVLWPFVSSFVSTWCSVHGSVKQWELSQRSRGPFYILCVDLAIIFFTIVEFCRHPISTGTPDWTFGGGLGKIMSIFVIILLASQDALLVPIAAFPRYITLPAVIATRLVSRPKNKRRVKRRSFAVEQLLSQRISSKEKALAKILQDDDIVQQIARHLHYDDLVNLSMTSKLMRASVFYLSTYRNRVESLCALSCVNGQKTECWACERVICSVCKSDSSHVQPSRIVNHFRHCYAVCTYCYLFSATGGGAPFRAKWKMQDLELQHMNCCALRKLQYEDDDLPFCRHCAKLDDAIITEMRERRDEVYLSRSLQRSIDCANCMKTLSPRALKWWFCDEGRHECHWAGHHA